MGRSRRQVLKGLGALAAVAGCGGRTRSAAIAGRAPLPGGFVPPAPDPIYTPSIYASDPGLLQSIEHVVVLCMENRSFDHLLGSRALLEGLPVDGLTGNESNADPDGNPIAPFVLTDFAPDDPPHGWDKAHFQWDGGKNDNFVKAHEGASQNEVMGYHTREQIPTIHQLADRFAVCDRWFASVMGPTWPNRFYLHAATSKGIQANTLPSGLVSVLDVLADAGISRRTYFHDIPFQASYLHTADTAPIEQFFNDAAIGALPSFTIVDPKFSGNDANDDHPAHDVHLGQALMASVYAALSQGPLWPKTLFVITYDENGGFFDHVAPGTTYDDWPDFDRLGFRVPSLVIGPSVRAGATVSNAFDHVSVISTLTRRWNLPLLNTRVAKTADVSPCIDPALVGDPQPAPMLAPVTVSLDSVRRRLQRGEIRTQSELQDLADHGGVPRHLDRRADGPDITRRVLEAGQRLGAVRLID